MMLRFFSKIPSFKTSIYDIKPDIKPIVTNSSFEIAKVRPTSKCKRSAVLALKQGMTAMWDKWGQRHALTVLQIDRCQVVQVKSYLSNYYLQLGVGERSISHLTKPLIGHFLKADVPPKQSLMECKVSQNCLLPPGYELLAQHFIPGQYVDVKGLTKGKGFQGGIKRWNFNRQTTTHGNSVTTRAIGSTGQRQDPGRTFPGKKMPGQLGNSYTTTHKLRVYKIDAKRNLLFIKGSVPGGWGTVIRVSDSAKDLTRQYRKLPHPTYLGHEPRMEVEVMDAPEKDTLEESYLHDNSFPNIKDDDPIKYRLISKKGEGTFSEVLKAQSIRTGKFVAIKCMKNHFNSIEQVNALREIQALRRLSPHPQYCLVSDEPTGRLALVFELMELNLYEWIKGRRHYLPEAKVKNYIYQLLKAIDHMHRNGIFHRDIKPENVLISEETLKLADLGSCKGVYSKQPYTEYISTRWYRPPECLLTDGYYDYKMDIWGVGCVFFEVMALFPLFPGNNELDQVHRIHKVLGTPAQEVLAEFEKKATHMKFNFPQVEGTGFERHVTHVSAAGKDLIAKMLIYKCDERISARQALKHVYFKELVQMEKPLRVFPSPLGNTEDSAGEDDKTELVLPAIKTSKKSDGSLKMAKSYKTFGKIPSITKKIVLENRKINLSPVKRTL